MLLEVHDLTVAYRSGDDLIHAVRSVQLSIAAGEAVGIIGESGCGKSTLVKALLRLLPPNAFYKSGQILFKGRDLLKMSLDELRPLRWKEFALIPQSAMNALNPVYNVGAQIEEAILIHTKIPRRQARERTRELMQMVGLPAQRLKNYPHELSGGTRQRVCLAMAMALNPDLLLADEPTTALDVVLQRQILNQIQAIRRQHGSALILVSHDISVIAENCDRVAVMYGGKVVESGPTRELLNRPVHPYTIGLRNAFPSLESNRQTISIPGRAPDLRQPNVGCVFKARCPFSTPECHEHAVELEWISDTHQVACIHHREAERFRLEGADPATWVALRNRIRQEQREPTRKVLKGEIQ